LLQGLEAAAITDRLAGLGRSPATGQAMLPAGSSGAACGQPVFPAQPKCSHLQVDIQMTIVYKKTDIYQYYPGFGKYGTSNISKLVNKKVTGRFSTLLGQ